MKRRTLSQRPKNVNGHLRNVNWHPPICSFGRLKLFRDFQKALETTTATKRRKIWRKICSKCEVSNLSFHGRCISRSLHDSAKVVISRLLTRNCCSLAAVVSATFCLSIPLNDGQVEKSSSHGRCYFGISVGRTGTLESRSFVAVVVSCAV